jgi:tight adherence protein C
MNEIIIFFKEYTTLIILIFIPQLILILLFSINFYIKNKRRNKSIIMLSNLDIGAIISHQNNDKINKDVYGKSFDKEKELKTSLIQAGITLKEYNEAKLIFAFIGIFISIILPFFVSLAISILIIIIGIICVLFGGNIYIYIAKAERIEKIDKDLGTFLDLVNVILEAGGSLKNAFFTVSIKGKNIIDDELLKEIAILEYEMTNYSTKQAYENLKKRVDSVQMDKIVEFLILSEETGIGVKNIFASQANDMRQDSFYKIKGKVSTLNMYLMVIIFVFVLPAVGAFVVFPMRAGVLDTGF